MPAPPLKQRLRYRFDNFMARGGRSIFLSLVVVFPVILILLIAARGLAHLLTGSPSPGFGWDSFTTFLQMTDPGSMAEDMTSRGWYQAIGITAGVVGIVMLSALIAFITTALDRRSTTCGRGIPGWSRRLTP